MTTTNDPTKFARLDHRGLYIQNGALQITSTDGTTVIDGSGVKTSKIYTCSLSGINMSIGSGNNVFKADASGIYLGNTNCGAAPSRIDMQGNAFFNNVTLSGTINSSKMNNSDIIGGTLTVGSGNSFFKADTNGIYLGNANFGSAPFRVTPTGAFVVTNATISRNINMTGGNISWANVGKPTYSASEVGARNINWLPNAGEIGAVYNNQTAVFNALTNNGSTRGLFMSGGQLYVNADYINSGIIRGIDIFVTNITGSSTITGARIKTAASGRRLEVDSNCITSYNANNLLEGVNLNSSNFSFLDFYYAGQYRRGLGQAAGVIQLTSTIGSIVIETGKYSSTQMRGKVDFSGATVIGLDTVARFG